MFLKLGDLTLASGKVSKFKIECDALDTDDWETAAFLASKIVPPFEAVYGVPRGGIPFAQALDKYKSSTGQILICDDVYTSGKSIREYENRLRANGTIPDGRVVRYCVLFSRGDQPYNVQALFNLNSQLHNI